MKGLDIYTHEEEGYKAKLDFESWRVAYINYAERFDRNKLQRVERHMLTDEVFVLLKGEGGLFIGEDAEEVVMEPHKIYNVTKGTWHHTWVSKDAQVLIVENSNTCKDNTEYREIKR